MSNVKVIKDTKFKNIYVSIRFLSALKKENILSRLVLANIINESCNKYPSKQAVTDHLDEMYGATYSATSNIVGSAQLMVCKSKIIHPKYIESNSNLLEEQFSLLHEFIFSPLMKNERFDERIFVEAKRNLMDMIARSNDDPSTYCMQESMRVAGSNQPLGWGVYGSEQDVEAITMEEVVKQYHLLISEENVDILVLGDVEEKQIQSLVKKYLPFSNKCEDKVECVYRFKDEITQKHQTSYKDISQSYITNLYICDVTNKDDEFAALRVANAILGQLPTSLLFQEVREKNSLCYSIYSALFPYDGVMGICTGVELNNVDKALDLIEKQVNRMKSGDFDEVLIDTAKKMLVNSLLATKDDADSLFALVYRNILFDRNETIEEVIEKIKQIKKEDVVMVMSKVSLCLSYVLKSRDQK